MEKNKHLASDEFETPQLEEELCQLATNQSKLFLEMSKKAKDGKLSQQLSPVSISGSNEVNVPCTESMREIMIESTKFRLEPEIENPSPDSQSNSTPSHHQLDGYNRLQWEISKVPTSCFPISMSNGLCCSEDGDMAEISNPACTPPSSSRVNSSPSSEEISTSLSYEKQVSKSREIIDKMISSSSSSSSHPMNANKGKRWSEKVESIPPFKSHFD